MLLAHENGLLKIYAETYSLQFAKDRPYVTLMNSQGARIADLFYLSSIHSLNGRDDCLSSVTAANWQVEEHLGEMVLALNVVSSIWQSKTIRFRCQPRRLRYEVEINGSGEIDQVNYFGGYYSGQVRWGSGFFWSGQSFQQGFNPEPTVDEDYSFPAEANSSINLTGVPLPGKADWFFTPPPFCFAFEAPGGWLGLGVEARAGDNCYTEYHYHGTRSAFYLSLAYEGHTRVEGHYKLPAIAFDFGADPYTLLAMHVQHLRASGLVPIPTNTSRPAWWGEPLFCGWGAQCYLAGISGGRAPEYATQASYEAFLHTLDNHDLFPGTVVLDDKWQASYGENDVDTAKWPDLPGFIRERHEQGQHVLLWIKAWDPEGVPPEECITNAAGLPLAVDPTNPAFERRLRASVRRMLSSEGYDADGFKIDFSARIPSGPGLVAHGDAWGLELMRCYLRIIYQEAHRVKPDAFVITHTPHPYLADLMDAVRLNDINTAHNIRRQMTHRARVATIACPEALIDMDNWPIFDKAAWLDYLTMRPSLGIPALYFASHIDSTQEPLSEADYALIRQAWAEYRASMLSRQRRLSSQKISELGGVLLQDATRQVKRLAHSTTQAVAEKPLKAWPNEIFPRQA